MSDPLQSIDEANKAGWYVCQAALNHFERLPQELKAKRAEKSRESNVSGIAEEEEVQELDLARFRKDN